MTCQLRLLRERLPVRAFSGTGGWTSGHPNDQELLQDQPLAVQRTTSSHPCRKQAYVYWGSEGTSSPRRC